MYFEKISIFFVLVILITNETSAGDDDYNVLHTNGAYEFGYNNPDSYHYAQANRNNVVKGEFGGRNPKTGTIDSTIYTAGPRGFRPRGKNVVRKYDLSQAGPRPVGSRYDPYFDPYEDPSYSFSFRTRTYNRDENANRVGDVTGRYSYTDDVGERHNVEYIAGKNTGFHVKTPFPDSNPKAYGPLYFRGRGRPIPRGRTSIQRGLDGSYKFVSAGPDQRRTETSDATGHVRGSYTYLDDKGVQHSVHYIAGPETGYRVLKTVKGPHLPTVFPFNRPDIIPPDFYDYNDKDVFDTAASGHVKPGRPGGRPGGRPPSSKDSGQAEQDNGVKEGDSDFGKLPGFDDSGSDFEFGQKTPSGIKPSTAVGGKPSKSPYDEDGSDGYDTDFGDLFGDGGGKKEGPGKGGSSKLKPTTTTNKPFIPSDGSFGNGISKEDSSGSKEDGASKPSNEYIPPEDGKSGEGSEEDYGSKGDRFGKPSTGPSSTRPSGSYRPSGRPQSTFSTEDDDFGLFGSETNRPKPPYHGNTGSTGPVITIGAPNKNCPRCQGAVLTNVGDTYLSVPPGVSVRAHVQAIDLLPYSSRFPGPSAQYKSELPLNTEQLNSENDEIVGEVDITTESDGEEFSTEETTTDADVTTTLPNTSAPTT
ncbi:uncharacterized protein Cpr73D [Diabrotica undecimpunctata]|uniref:uncharacterized protein Cpr73D n=1 Tax=Diabrotica undecimpunctata TaxID=50387 RepID=UPI003B63604D